MRRFSRVQPEVFDRARIRGSCLGKPKEKRVFDLGFQLCEGAASVYAVRAHGVIVGRCAGLGKERANRR